MAGRAGARVSPIIFPACYMSSTFCVGVGGRPENVIVVSAGTLAETSSSLSEMCISQVPAFCSHMHHDNSELQAGKNNIGKT